MNKLQAWWIKAADAGIIKERIYLWLQKIFKFNIWHANVVNFRPYAQDIIDTVNEYIKKEKDDDNHVIVEVGCGLGDIIGNITYKHRIGIDLDTKAIQAGKLLHPSVRFQTGSFQTIENLNIKCLIMVNFIHEISEKDLRDHVEKLLRKNHVELVVIDSLRRIEDSEYRYTHRGEQLLGNDYVCYKISRPFSAASGAKLMLYHNT